MSDIFQWIQEQIDSSLIPGLMGFVKIKNQSRAYDPDWESDNLGLQACIYAAQWATDQKLQNFTVEVLQEKGRTPCVMAIVNSQKASSNVLMYGHLDKQPPLTEQWKSGLHPYDPVLKGGKLYGRGAADDGYAFFMSILVLKALQTFQLLTSQVTVIFETDEESQSKDVMYFIGKNAGKIGKPDLLICIDGSCIDYDHWCITTSLRGVVDLVMKVEVTSGGVHSGSASGIIPDSFRIARSLLERFECSKTGKLFIEDLYVNIPQDKYQQAHALIQEMGGKVDWGFPLLDGVQPTVADPFQQYLNRAWMPQMSLIGIDGVPNVKLAGNVLRPYTSLSLSIRTPPTLNKDLAKSAIENFFKTVPKPYNAKVSVELTDVSQGFNAKPLSPSLTDVIKSASSKFFGTDVLLLGDGVSFPLSNDFQAKFPDAQFVISGVLGPESNPHGPDECLHIPYLKKLACSLAFVIQNYKIGAQVKL